MSELSRQARRAMRAKIHRITKGDSGKVDASDYGPEEVLNAGVKTGMRPISRRAFKKGGKVVANEGKDAAKHAGKKPRNGGKKLTIDALVNRNVKDANEDREGIKHIGGLKTGGRAKKQNGGSFQFDAPRSGAAKIDTTSQAYKDAAAAAAAARQAAADRAQAKRDADAVARGNRMQGLEASEEAKLPRKAGGRAHDDEPEDRALIGKMVKKSALTGKKHGGMALDGEYQGTRPKGGRVAKKDGGSLAGLEMNKGGRLKKSGKTNINIVISAGKGQQQDQGAPGMPPRPAGIPVAIPPQGAGAPPMPAGGPPPMPMPPMGGAPAGGLGGAGPMGGAPMPRKAGGRTYRSYKDMDAGAGSGLGRLEKTEIQKRKK